MDSPLPKQLRYDGLWWRKFAALGSTYGPEWWKRASPAVIGAVCFAMIHDNRRGAQANMRRVLAESGGNPSATALQMFVEFAYCLSETLERFGPRPLPVRVDLPEHDPIREAIAAGTGAVVVTGHFGNWDIAALELLRYERPTHVVMAHEHNPSTNPYLEEMRAHRGLHVVYSDRSVLTSLELLHALRRNEIVALQIDRLATSDSAREVEMCGSAVRLPSGPFELARLSGAPLVPVFAPRLGARHYRIHLGQPWRLSRSASAEEVQRCIAGVAGEMEEMIRRHPDQWFQFEPFWIADMPTQDQSAPSPLPKVGWRGRSFARLPYARREVAIRSRTVSRRRSRSS